MSIQDEIYQKFFEQLSKDKDIPQSIIAGLVQERAKGQSVSEDKVVALIKGGYSHDNKD
jgi:hypothetical protein